MMVGEDSLASVLTRTEHDVCFNSKIESLFCSKDCSDITLLFGDQRIPSHRLVLACRSHYFRKLVYGTHKDVAELELKDTPMASFIVLLQYIYTGRLVLDTKLQPQNLIQLVLDVLVLAHRYGFSELESSISDNLKSMLSAANFATIYEYARNLGWSSLAEDCLLFADTHAKDVIKREAFPELSAIALKEVISRDSFIVSEVDIFNSVCAWKRRNPDDDVTDLLSAIRLPLMEQQDLIHVVMPSRLVSSDVILEALQRKSELGTSASLRPRATMLPEVNVASAEFGAQVIHGKSPHHLLDENIQHYDEKNGITGHEMGDGIGIVVELDKRYIINYIKMLLMDKNDRSYSYCIEVSVNKEDWYKVIDYTNFLCRSWQKLYFEPQVARYIRIMGTRNSHELPDFGVVSFQCLFTKEKVNIKNGVLYATDFTDGSKVPFYVHHVQMGNFIECINCEVNNVTDSGTVLHLSQPIIVDTLRLQLNETSVEVFKYIIEVSSDNESWEAVSGQDETVVEESNEWTTHKIQARIVLYVRLTAKETSGEKESPNFILELSYKGLPTTEISSASVSESPEAMEDLSPHPVDPASEENKVVDSPVQTSGESCPSSSDVELKGESNPRSLGFIIFLALCCLIFYGLFLI